MVKKLIRKTLKKPLTEWNKFVMEVKKQNPDKMFKDILVLAGKLKKKGVKLGDVVKNKSVKVMKKIKSFVPKNNTARKGKKDKTAKKGKKGKTAKKGRKGRKN